MKNVFFIICISFYLICNSNAAGYKVGNKVKNIFEPVREFKIDLPPGEWIVTQSANDAFYGLRWKSYILIRLENGKFAEAITFEQIKTAGVYEYIVNDAIIKIVYKNKYDGCYERPEYYYLNFYRKGTTVNCLRIGHRDINKRVYDPRDPELRNVFSQLKKWLKNISIDLPKIGFWSSHWYFSRLVKGTMYHMHYYADPSTINAPKNSFFIEETSEYHKNKIKNFPEHERSMKKWVSISANRHLKFEKSVRAKERHLLNLNTIISSGASLNSDQSNDIIEQLKKLNDLYKSGVLNEVEFEKAKKKILN